METYEISRHEFGSQYLDRPDENTTGLTHEEDDLVHGLLKEVDGMGHNMRKRLVSKVEKNVRVGRTVVDEFREKHDHHHVLGKIKRKLTKGGDDENDDVIHVVGEERGLDVDDLQEIKVERFKVKNVNIMGAGIVKEEELHPQEN